MTNSGLSKILKVGINLILCPICLSSDIALNVNINVRFQFNKENDVEILSDVADDIYWGVVYDELPSVCQCLHCNHTFDYDSKKYS